MRKTNRFDKVRWPYYKDGRLIIGEKKTKKRITLPDGQTVPVLKLIPLPDDPLSLIRSKEGKIILEHLRLNRIDGEGFKRILLKTYGPSIPLKEYIYRASGKQASDGFIAGIYDDAITSLSKGLEHHRMGMTKKEELEKDIAYLRRRKASMRVAKEREILEMSSRRMIGRMATALFHFCAEYNRRYSKNSLYGFVAELLSKLFGIELDSKTVKEFVREETA